MRMSKTFRSGKITGEVVVSTKDLSQNVLKILPKSERRSLVINDINFSSIGGGGFSALYEFKPIEVGETITVVFPPNALYKSARRGFFNWIIDAIHVQEIQRQKGGN